MTPAAAPPTGTEQPYQRTSGPIHSWFALTYANFLVLHRALLQSMPLRWQQQLVDLLEELDAAYPEIKHPDFKVTTVRDCYLGDLTDAERQALGITESDGEEDSEDPDADVTTDTVYYDREGTELTIHDHVGVPVADPIPHYRHAYLPPDEAAIAGVRARRRETADMLAGDGHAAASPARQEPQA
jgi:hypothetical protein